MRTPIKGRGFINHNQASGLPSFLGPYEVPLLQSLLTKGKEGCDSACSRQAEQSSLSIIVLHINI